MSKEFFINYNNEVEKLIKSINPEDLILIAEKIKNTSSKGNKIILAGNGGSAAMASHLAVDLTKTAKIRSINFNEADLITCFANDFGYENIYSKSLEFYADSGDLVILISSSGKSINMIRAAEYTNEKSIELITLTGHSENNPLKKLGSINLWANSKSYNIVEMTHHIWLLSICDYIIGDIYTPA